MLKAQFSIMINDIKAVNPPSNFLVKYADESP